MATGAEGQADTSKWLDASLRFLDASFQFEIWCDFEVAVPKLLKSEVNDIMWTAILSCLSLSLCYLDRIIDTAQINKCLCPGRELSVLHERQGKS